MKILLIDDHAVLREGLKQILADGFEKVQFGEAGNTGEAFDQLASGQWDVVVLDINLPGRNGLEVLRDARSRHPKLPILVLSSAPEEQLGVRVLKAGASGYLNKQTAPEELVQAVRKLCSGGRYIGPRLAEKLASDLAHSEKPPHEQLSDREFQVMQMLAAGESLKEIADTLSLSVKTISTFRGRILAKLKLENNVGLAHYAREHNLLAYRAS